MHVCIDFRPALRHGTGVGTYVRNLVAGLRRTHPETVLTALSASFRDRLGDVEGLDVAVRRRDWRIPVRLLDWSWHRWGWPPVEWLAGAQDVAHSPSPLLVPASRARQIVTVHDCWFLRHPEDVFGPVRRDYVPRARASAARADAVVVPSRTTGDEVQELLEVPADRIRVTHLGVDPAFLEAAEALDDVDPRGSAGAGGEDAAAPGPGAAGATREPMGDAPAPDPPGVGAGRDAGYLLFVGRREPRKDLGTLLDAVDRLRRRLPDVRLVLAGPDAPGWRETWNAAPVEARRRTELLGHQPPRALAVLYRRAAALVMCSRWEGFGLTALEAAAVGTPVVATRAGSLPEVLDDAARWVDVGDAAGLADACAEVLTDGALARELRERGRRRSRVFRWERTAELTHDLYEELTGR